MTTNSKKSSQLNTRQAAEFFGNNPSHRTLERWRKQSTADRRIGPRWIESETGRIYYRQDALEEWQNSREVQPQDNFRP